jgi:hypothetical protein
MLGILCKRRVTGSVGQEDLADQQEFEGGYLIKTASMTDIDAHLAWKEDR